MRFANRFRVASRQSAFAGANNPSNRRTQTRRRTAGVRLECLEGRRLLSISVTSNHDAATDGSLTSLIGAILTADSTSGGDTITLPANTTFTLSQTRYIAPMSGNG